MKKTYYIGIAVLALLITTLAVSVSTFAFPGKSGQYGYTNHTWQKKDFTAEKQSLADMTYEEWEVEMQAKVQAMHERADKLESNITEDNFETLQQIHQLIEDGNFEEAKALKADLDIFDHGEKTGFKVGGHWKK